METRPPENVIDALAAAVGSNWEMIKKAGQEANSRKARLASSLAGLVSHEDMSVVVFGSLARNEVTSGSDTDWALLIDGQASSTHFEVAREISRTIEKLEQKSPGREGTFGGLAISHDILHRIGGGEDTNRNLTQRILLLLESEALGPSEAYGRVLRGVIERYITEDAGWNTKSVTVPRFLLNDIARYWRTVAVDFAYKRRERSAKGFALRTIKLRLSRKLTYASGLLACFGCASDAAVTDRQDRAHAAMDHLLSLTSLSPLERVAKALLDENLLEPAASLFDSYEQFLGMLDNEAVRKELDELTPEEAETNSNYEHAREIGHNFQAALDQIFFGDNGTSIPQLTQKYGVF